MTRANRTEAERIERTGKRINAAVWLVAGIVMLFSLGTVYDLLTEVDVPERIAWMLAPAVDIALCAALFGDRVLSRHGERAAWGTALRWVTALMTLGLNTGTSWGVGGDGIDWPGVAIHAVPPVLLIFTTEAAQSYQVAFARLVARHAAEQEARDQDRLARDAEREAAELAARRAVAEAEREAAEATARAAAEQAAADRAQAELVKAEARREKAAGNPSGTSSRKQAGTSAGSGRGTGTGTTPAATGTGAESWDELLRRARELDAEAVKRSGKPLSGNRLRVALGIRNDRALKVRQTLDAETDTGDAPVGDSRDDAEADREAVEVSS